MEYQLGDKISFSFSGREFLSQGTITTLRNSSIYFALNPETIIIYSYIYMILYTKTLLIGYLLYLLCLDYIPIYHQGH